MILGQHKAAQFRPEVAIHPARQRRHDQLPVRRQPALPAIADAAGPQDQVLNDEICVALKPRAGWHRGLDDLVFDGHARRHRTAAALAKVRRLRLAGLLHSARFERWPALEPFQPCDLRTLGRYRLLQGRHLAQQPDDKRLQFSQGECVEVTGWSHPSRESEASVSGKRKPRCRHPFCRCYLHSRISFGRAELFGGFVEFRKRSACVLPIEIHDARFLRLAQACCIEAGARLDAKTLQGEELAGHFSHEQLLGIVLFSNDNRLREGSDGRLNGENCDQGAREEGAPGPSAPHPHGRVCSRRAWGLTKVPPIAPIQPSIPEAARWPWPMPRGMSAITMLGSGKLAPGRTCGSTRSSVIRSSSPRENAQNGTLSSVKCGLHAQRGVFDGLCSKGCNAL